MEFADLDLGAIQRQFTAKMDEFSSTQEKLRSLSASATSPKRLLTVTVGAQGELTEVKFHTEAYRTMARAELEHTVMETIVRAREDVLAKMREVVSPLAPQGMSVDDIMSGRFDPGDITESWLSALGGEPAPSVVADTPHEEDEKGRA
ncbi:YbaB/EbfC family nucleoid-associated protein [Streptomyces chartreusis]